MKKFIIIFSISSFFCSFVQLKAQDSDNVLEEIPFDFMSRSPIYDYSEKNLNNTDTIPGFDSQESKLKISGTIFQSDGVTPAKDVILYIDQPNQDGEYDLQFENDKRFVYNRGWIKTDANGHYTFYTFIPGSYRHTRELRQIHPIVKVAGKQEYNLNSFIFEDDPFLTKACRKKLKKKGINSILTTVKKEDMYVSTHNIVLK
ncbi:dioxygenase family protein [Formosa maritima]|uniref:Uncharacterized protein n=1 Tax=Formosa maritima TaxID=2592046 RepID=A0A5D0GJ27_9FLAO|nr:hypothetical protein [Formosa maritima]TYA58998.1 hypothetical protein FVF61_02285 [Formosa maritima]